MLDLNILREPLDEVSNPPKRSAHILQPDAGVVCGGGDSSVFGVGAASPGTLAHVRRRRSHSEHRAESGK